MSETTWRKEQWADFGLGLFKLYDELPEGDKDIAIVDGRYADQIIADHDAARVLADAVRLIRQQMVEHDEGYDEHGCRCDWSKDARGFFEDHPDLTAEGGAGR